MRLADQLLAAVGTLNDRGLAGAITSFAQSLAHAECFEMDVDLRDACVQVSRSRPSSIVSATPLTRLPYPHTWVEWQAGTFGSDRDPATENKPAPARMGCLVEAVGSDLARGRMNWAWAHNHTELGLMICPYSLFFDWHGGADVPQQIAAIVEAGLTEKEKLSRLAAAGFVPDIASNREVVRRWQVSPDEASKYMRASKKWGHLSANPTEREAFMQLERQCILQPSFHCFGLWAEAGYLPNFEERRASWLDDIEGEMPFAQAFFVMLNAKGAIATQKDDLSRLNRNRARRGKRALREFVVTRLNLGKGAVNRAAARGGSREAARLHLVRGHFKVRKTGIYWWSPYPRGQGDVALRERYLVGTR